MTVTTQEPTLQELADEAAFRTNVAAELNDGTEHWHVHYPEAGSHEAALDLAREDMQDAWRQYEAAGGSAQQ